MGDAIRARLQMPASRCQKNGAVPSQWSVGLGLAGLAAVSAMRW